MSVIPCGPNDELRAKIEAFAEILQTQAHTLGEHGLTESEFYESGLFRGAIEQIRGQFSATKREKQEFIQRILNYLEDRGAILGWERFVAKGRTDYVVRLCSERRALVVAKGCLDGNNTKIFERPADIDELVVWSLCTNVGADMPRNAWSGIHTRLGTAVVDDQKSVDGVIIWDIFCGTDRRPCPKNLRKDVSARWTVVGQFRLPPPCIYVFPRLLNRSSRQYATRVIADVEILSAFHETFGGMDDELNTVAFATHRDEHSTTVWRNGVILKQSDVGVQRSPHPNTDSITEEPDDF